MKNYGGSGGKVDRTAIFYTAFRRIRSSFDEIKVAGFTEITNNSSATTGLRKLVEGLFGKIRAGGGLHQLAVVNCGRTALGRTEYVGYAVKRNITIRGFGRIYVQTGSKVVVDEAPVTTGVSPQVDVNGRKFKDWAKTMSTDALADYRVIVYAALELGDKIEVIGFVHNMYTLDNNRMSFMQMLPTMMAAAQGDDNIYVGGDFNVKARDIGSARRKKYYHYSKPMVGKPSGNDEKKFTGGGTLLSGRLYDYWFSNIAKNSASAPKPYIATNTLRMRGLSDHCGILLELQ
ncbi:hypothetical protein DF182_25850 [Chitinophaga flava]|uniref:Endonuclease/exonuclease/phosphatase domain-containing protein n=2 Tax=Chitinophaga flava TaxID=2259036 RepID=A0A365XW18_9BACT|nr:hypothetical protein DF182_25850 [Chitinophaga flava]